jgi:hypothetical protein
MTNGVHHLFVTVGGVLIQEKKIKNENLLFGDCNLSSKDNYIQ